MKIRWLGHSAFLLTAESGSTLLTDPYNTTPYGAAMRYKTIDESPDVVTISHTHSDHNNPEILGGQPEVLRAPGERLVAGFNILGIPTFHDTELGARRGENVVFRISVDGITLCHLGDLGHVLEGSQVEEIGPVDVLFIPVGGTYTVDAAGATRVWQQILPPVTIPMHYRNEKCHLDLEGVDPFLAGKPGVEEPGVSEIDVEKENLPPSPKIVVLRPAN